MRPVAPILFAILASSSPAMAEPANLAIVGTGSDGAAGRVVLAQRTYQQAMRTGDAILLLASIRLARTVTTRPPTGWIRTTTGEASADQPVPRPTPNGPASPEAIAIVQALAGEDPMLQDLVYDLDAQLPHGRQTLATEATAGLAAGQTDSWRIALSGDVAAELGLIGDGDSPLGLTIADGSGNVVCAIAPRPDPGLCRFTAARNGFFMVTVRNSGTVMNSYRLIGS